MEHSRCISHVPKHVRHFVAFPIFPKTAPSRGALFVPHVNQEQVDFIEYGHTLCAIFLRMLSTTSVVVGVVSGSSTFPGTELDDVAVLFSVAASLRTIVVGVIGAFDCFAGVGGSGRFPSIAGLQPVNSVSAITFLV